LLESVEIRKHWPVYNVSQKVRASNYGICLYTDSVGYLRLVIDKLQRTQPFLYRTAYLVDVHRLLWRLVQNFELDPYLCCLSKVPSALLESHELYNEKVLKAVAFLKAQQPTYLLQEATDEGISCVLVEKGSFYGFGMLPNNFKWRTINDIKKRIKQYPANEHINAMIRSFEERYAGKMTYL
jgi:DNA polymerase-3 subunit epsilon